jgi:type II secretory pathway pseudopilin PulG
MTKRALRCAVRNAEHEVSPGNNLIPLSDDQHARGFTYVALLAAIVIIGISLGAAGKYWSNVMMREKEEELLFRGDQYRNAIERYYLARQPFTFPNSIDNLLSDDRFPQAKRYLRRKYVDPITGEDFELIRDPANGNRIIGVHSKSELEPLRKTGFPDRYQDFEGQKSFVAWKFVYVPQQQPGVPAGGPVRGMPPPPHNTNITGTTKF